LHELLICQLTHSHFHLALSQLRKFGVPISPHQLSVISNERHQTNNKRQPTTQSVKKNKQSNVPFLLPLHVLFSVHWPERTRHHPASVMISSHSVSLIYHYIDSCLIKLHMPPSTSSARMNFASIIRCQINLLHTSCLWVAAVSLFHTICKAASNVNYTSYFANWVFQ